MQNTNNPEVQRVFEWLLGFIKPAKYRFRKEAIFDALRYIANAP